MKLLAQGIRNEVIELMDRSLREYDHGDQLLRLIVLFPWIRFGIKQLALPVRHKISGRHTLLVVVRLA